MHRGGSCTVCSPEIAFNMQLPAYAELHCLSNFSFLRGASHPDELVAQAAVQEIGRAHV